MKINYFPYLIKILLKLWMLVSNLKVIRFFLAVTKL